MHIYLKVKADSLAAEARIIRRLERQQRDRARALRARASSRDTLIPSLDAAEQRRLGLYRHRTVDVRRAARTAHLALGFLRGRAYHEMERKTYAAPSFDEVEKLVRRYGEGDQRELVQRFANWLDDAKAHLKLARAEVAAQV